MNRVGAYFKDDLDKIRKLKVSGDDGIHITPHGYIKKRKILINGVKTTEKIKVQEGYLIKIPNFYLVTLMLVYMFFVFLYLAFNFYFYFSPSFYTFFVTTVLFVLFIRVSYGFYNTKDYQALRYSAYFLTVLSVLFSRL